MLIVCRLIVVRVSMMAACRIDPRIIFGKRVRQLRLECRLSQEKLAELADLHRNYLGGVEREERNVSLVNIVKLAHGLNPFPVAPA